MANRRVFVIGESATYSLCNAVGATQPTVVVEFENEETLYRIDFDPRVILNSMDTEFWTSETVALKTLDPNGIAYICDLGLYYHYNRQLVLTAFFRPDTMRHFIQELKEEAVQTEKEYNNAEFPMDFFADV